MLRFSAAYRGRAGAFSCTVAVLNAAGHFGHGGDPYHILGVTKATPFEDIRHRFHELAQQYHPDMPHGDPNKFRDINAAYRQIRADYRQQKESFTETAFGRSKRDKTQATGGDFWAERNEQVRQNMNRMAAARRRAEDRDSQQRRAHVKRTKGIFRAIYDYLYDAEIWLSACLIGVVFLYGAERYYYMQVKYLEWQEHLLAIDVGLPPALPMEVDPVMRERYSVPVDKRLLQEDTERVIAESHYRKATQRRFEDFREFMYVYDPESVADRRVSTERFSFQYMHADQISKRCPILREFNSEVKRTGYDSIERELVQTLQATPWVSPDVGYAAGLVAKGLACIPASSPNTAKWTFIEYQDTSADSKKNKKSEPVCLAAIRNLRFDTVGMCQRTTVTGRPDLVPELVERREEALKSGALKKKQLVSGSVLPTKDLSVSLKDMKL